MFRKVRDAVLASDGAGVRNRSCMVRCRAQARISRRGPRLNRRMRRRRKWPVGDRLKAELLFWESMRDSKYPADIQAYLDKYPRGTYEVLARNRLKRLGDVRKEAAPRVGSVLAAPVRETAPGRRRSQWRLRWVWSARTVGGFRRVLRPWGSIPARWMVCSARPREMRLARWQSVRGGTATGYLEAELAKTLLAVNESMFSPSWTSRSRAKRPAHQAAERERLVKAAREREETQRRAHQAAERERLVKAAREREETQRRAREAAERERLARVAREKEEAQRKAREAAELERLARVAREKEEAQRRAREAAERERLARVAKEMEEATA